MRFCFLQDESMYQPWHKRRSLPAFCPYLVTSNIAPNYKVNANYNVHCSKDEHFATPVGQISENDQWYTRYHYHANESTRGLEVQTVRALGALCSLRSKRRLRPRNDEKHTFTLMKTKGNRLRIKLRDKPLGDEREFKTQRWDFHKNRDR